MGDIFSPRIKVAKSTPVKRQHKGPFMEVMIGDNVKPGRSIGIERDETDYVSAWILALAVGMIVLGTVFAVLDLCDLLPPLPAAAVACRFYDENRLRRITRFLNRKSVGPMLGSP
jgi:hypothetical protein